MSKKYEKVLKTVNDQSIFHSQKGQFLGGYTIGILAMDIWYPKLPGNVANATTYDFPVLYKRLDFDEPLDMLKGDPKLLPEVIKKGQELVNDGVRAIICACGYLGYFQKELSAALDVPVYTSSLLQIPLIKMGLKANQRIGLLCANKENMKDRLLASVGVNDSTILEIVGMSDQSEFQHILYNDLAFNNDTLTQQVVTKVQKMVANNPDIGAILIECSDLPPYAAAIQDATNLPVFDFTTMINWVHQSVQQKDYRGVL